MDLLTAISAVSAIASLLAIVFETPQRIKVSIKKFILILSLVCLLLFLFISVCSNDKSTQSNTNDSTSLPYPNESPNELIDESKTSAPDTLQEGINSVGNSAYNDGSKASMAIVINTDSPKMDFLETSSDQKWYKVTLFEPGKITLSFEHGLIESTNTFWVITAYESSRFTGAENELGQLMTINSAGNETKLESSFLGLSAGTYYIKVTSYSGSYNSYHSTEKYELIVKYEETHFCELEVNNIAAMANNIELNTSYAGSITHRSDKDWFKFDLDNPGMVELNFVHLVIESPNPYWVITMYDASEYGGYEGDLNPLITFCSEGNKTNITSSFLGLPSGTYYVQVTSYSGSYNSYHDSMEYGLSVNYAGTDYCEMEINNTASSANNLELNLAYTGSLTTSSDKDWFTFKLSKSSIVTLNFKHDVIESSNPYWVITVYDATKYEGYEGDLGHLLTFYSDGNETSVDSALLGLPSGTYYVQVTSYSGAYNSYHDTGDYQLTINYLETDYSELEINNTATAANLLKLNASYTGSLTTSSDVDWFKFDLSQNEVVTISFRHELIESSNFYWVISVYDASKYGGYEGDLECIQSLYVEGNNTDSFTSAIILPAGTYYAKITSYSGSYNSYHTSDPYEITIIL